ncbi:MAG: hypothetical protein ACYC1P_04015 [Gaiellaceae bacterium]
MKKVRWTALCAAAVAATAVSWASGALTSAPPSSTIEACRNDQNGNLRIVADAGACRTAESYLSWNAQGATGDARPAGPAGPMGPQGPRGADGAPGPAGATGEPGAKGDPGPAGADGADGVDGAAGADGAPGADGVSAVSAAEPAGANCADGGSRFTAGASVTFACNGADGADGAATGGPAYERVGGYVATGTPVQLSSAPGFGVLSIRCIGSAGSDVQLSNPAGSGALLTIWTGYYSFTINEGGATGWAAAGGAPRIVITSASLPTPGHPLAETMRVLTLDVAIGMSGSACTYLVRSSTS